MWRVPAVVVIALWVAPAAAERLRGPDGNIKEVPDASVEYALKDGYARLPKVVMRGPNGALYEIDEDVAERMEREQGFWRLTPSELAERTNEILRDVTEERSTEERWHWIKGIGLIVGVVGGICALLRPWRYWRAPN